MRDRSKTWPRMKNVDNASLKKRSLTCKLTGLFEDWALTSLVRQIAKDVYLMSIAVANNNKKLFFGRDLPDFHNVNTLWLSNLEANLKRKQYQLVWTLMIDKFRETLHSALNMQQQHITSWSTINLRLKDSVLAIDAGKDQGIYAQFNTRPFFQPNDDSFIPCSLWHDNSDVVVLADAKTYLQNLLATRQKGKSAFIRSARKTIIFNLEIDTSSSLTVKQKEVHTLSELADRYIKVRVKLI